MENNENYLENIKNIADLLSLFDNRFEIVSVDAEFQKTKDRLFNKSSNDKENSKRYINILKQFTKILEDFEKEYFGG